MKQINLMIISASLIVNACAPVKAIAPNSPLSGIELREFAATDYYLANNKIFLWRMDMSQEHVANAFSISQKIDRADARVIELGREEESLRQYLKPYYEAHQEVEKVEKQEKDLKRTMNQKKQLISKEEKKPAEQQNQVNLTKWREEVAAAETSLSDIVNHLASAKQHEEAVAAEVDLPIEIAPDPEDAIRSESQSQTRAQEGYLKKMTRRERLVDIETKKMQNGKESSDALADLLSQVEWYDKQPNSISFNFVDGQPIVQINGWGLHGDENRRDFTNSIDGEADPRLGTIANVTYQSRGGVFRFDLGVFTEETLSPQQKQNAIIEARAGMRWDPRLREVFNFRIARNNYRQTEIDGRIFFAGKIYRYREVKGPYCDENSDEYKKYNCERQGSLKLVNSNN